MSANIGQVLLVAAMAATPSLAFAQNQCAIPDRLPAAQPERVDPRAVRDIPTTDYVLAVSWSPQYCRRGGADRLQCGRGSQFGFILHGLWPEGAGREWPQYCRPVGAVPPEVIRRTFCATPSVDLQQNEWQKHGSCVTGDPAAYFRAATALFGGLRFPEMNRLSRQTLDVAEFTRAFAAVNRGMRPDMVRVQLSNGGWLEEVRVCLGRDFRPMTCPSDTPGARARQSVRIWRRER